MKTNNGKRLMAAVIAFVMVACAVAVVASPLSADGEVTAPAVDVSKAQTYTVDSVDDFAADAFGGAYDATNKILVVPADGIIINVTADVTVSDLRIVLNGDLQITGDGKLSITATSKGNAYGAYAITFNTNDAVLSIKGADVTIDTNETKGSALNNMYSYTPATTDDGKEGTWAASGITGGVSVTEKGILTVKHTAGGTTWLGGTSKSGTPWLIVNDATVNFDGTQSIHGVVLDADKADINFTNVLIGLTTLGGSSLTDSSVEVNGADYNGFFIKGDITLDNSTIDVKNSGKSETNPRSGIMVLNGETDAVTVTMDSASTISTTESIMVTDASADGYTEGTNTVNFVGGTVSGTFEPAKSNASTAVPTQGGYTLNGTTVSNSTLQSGAKITSTEGFSVSGTFTAEEKSTISADSKNVMVLADAKANIAGEITGTVIAGEGSTVVVPADTTYKAVSKNVNVTVGTEKKEIAEGDLYKPVSTDITDQADLEQIIALGVASITLPETMEITGNMVIDTPVVITGGTNGLTLKTADTQITFSNGAKYDGKVTFTDSNSVKTTVDVNLSGNFTLKAGSVEIIDFNGDNADTDSIDVTEGEFVLTGALNSKVTVNLNGGAVILRDLNITSSGSIYFVGNTATITVENTVSVYGQIMSNKDITINVPKDNTFRAYGGSVLQDTVTVSGDGTVNIDGAMHTLTVNDDMASTNTYGQTQTVVIGSTLDIVSGTTITIQGQFVVNEGVTLTIQKGAKLVIDGATSVMDINGNVVVENGGIIEVKNSKAVDIAGAVDIYGTMTVGADGKVTIEENGKVTVAVDGALDVDAGTTVKAGATVDILGAFEIAAIENAGTINMTGAVIGAKSDITLDNGGIVNINSFTVAEKNIAGTPTSNVTLTIKDKGTNYIEIDGTAALEGLSGMAVTATKTGTTDKPVYTLYVSGSIGAVDNTKDSSGDGCAVGLYGSNVVIEKDLTVGKNVIVNNNANKLTVSGTVTATDGTFNNSGIIDVTGTITVAGANTVLGGTVNAAYYSLTPTAGATQTKVYTTFENAVQSGATSVIVGVGTGAVVTATENVTVPGTVKTLTVNGILNIGAADNRDITVTIADGCNVTGTIEVYASLTFDNNRNVRGTVHSDVVIDNEPARTYTNLYTALASGAETVTVARNVTLTSNIEIPQGVTLVVPAGTGITFNAGVTMTVNGAVQTAVDLTGPTDGFDEKSASNTEDKKTARIVVNGKFMTSVTGKTAEAMYNQYKIAGAYYNISDSTGAFLVIEPVANAAANAASATNGIDIRGENTVNGVAFNGTKDKTLAVAINGKVSGDISLNYATLDINAQYDGTVSTATGAVELVNVTGIDIASVYKDVDGTAVESMTVSGQPSKAYAEGAAPTMTVASGEVTVPAAGLTIGSQTVKDVTTNVVALTVAEGATMAVNGQLSAYDITVYGELVSVNGGNVQLTEAFVFGTLTVAKDDTAAKIAAGTASIEKLYVGLDKKYDNITAAAVNGTVSGVKLMVVASQATVAKEFIDTFAESTAFNVEGSVWFTAYATGNTQPVTVDNVKVQDALFIGWAEKADGEPIEATGSTEERPVYEFDFNVGQYETLYAIIDYEIYTVTITADGGIGTVAIDGKVLVKTGNQFVISGLKAGTHTIDYIVNAGFEGTPTISVNGTAITGNSFTLSGTSDADRNVSISIYGTQPSTSTGGSTTSGGDDGLGLTDILLIILVVLIVIMAVIVALRLMRS